MNLTAKLDRLVLDASWLLASRANGQKGYHMLELLKSSYWSNNSTPLVVCQTNSMLQFRISIWHFDVQLATPWKPKINLLSNSNSCVSVSEPFCTNHKSEAQKKLCIRNQSSSTSLHQPKAKEISCTNHCSYISLFSLHIISADNGVLFSSVDSLLFFSRKVRLDVSVRAADGYNGRHQWSAALTPKPFSMQSSYLEPGCQV